MIQVYLGKKGLDKTWQQDFPEIVECNKCGGKCRIMFVMQENYEKGAEYVCNLHENIEGKFWPHDCIACAVYLCEKCFEANALVNQA